MLPAVEHAGQLKLFSKMLLKLWFQAAYLVMAQFQRQVGIASYETTFVMLNKLLTPMVVCTSWAANRVLAPCRSCWLQKTEVDFLES